MHWRHAHDIYASDPCQPPWTSCCPGQAAQSSSVCSAKLPKLFCMLKNSACLNLHLAAEQAAGTPGQDWQQANGSRLTASTHLLMLRLDLRMLYRFACASNCQHVPQTAHMVLQGAALRFPGQPVGDIKDANGRTALHFAAQLGQMDACQHLLSDMRVPVSCQDGEGASLCSSAHACS